MKNQLIIYAAVPLLLAGCAKNLPDFGPSAQPSAAEITFTVPGGLTRSVTETTTSNLNTFYGYFRDNASHESVSDAIYFTATKTSSLWTTGKYWPLGGDDFFFVACNKEFELFDDIYTGRPVVSFPSGLPTQDVVYACANTGMDGIEYGVPVALNFHHLFARVGSLSVNAQSGYTISNVSASLNCVPTSPFFWTDDPGYNSVIGSDYGGFTSLQYYEDADYNDVFGMYILPPPSFASKTLTVGSNDFLAIPGTYTLTVSYTLTKGDYTQSFTKSGSVTLVPGCINNITTTSVGGSAVELSLSITVQNWTSNAISASLS